MTTSGIRKVVVLGALSAVGEATARLYASEGAELALAGRSASRLDKVAADLRARGAKSCVPFALDLAMAGDRTKALGDMVAAIDGVDAIMLFYGALGDQRNSEQDLASARESIEVNFSSAAEWCLAAANVIEKQGKGVLVVVGSVAGDRGRQSNYIYGAAKAGVATLVQGIAHRLSASGGRAICIKMGFVDSPMTAHIARKGLLWAKPAAVAARIKKEADRGRRPIVYVPSFWRGIMTIIRNVPVSVMHRTKL